MMTEKEFINMLSGHMSEDVGDRGDIDNREMQKGIEQTARICKAQYDSFIKVGFNAEQAIRILVAMMEGM